MNCSLTKGKLAGEDQGAGIWFLKFEQHQIPMK